MSTHEKETFFQTYGWVDDWRQLPWSHEEPTLFLADICQQHAPGTALDIGCGAGTDSLFLAQQGWTVTSLDFMPKALEYTQQRAEEAGVSVNPVEADITEWEPEQAYDVVLDHGLLHNMDPVRYPAYRERVLKALGDEGHFVLLHWLKRFPDEAQGGMGPTRVSREDIKAFFAPELQERFFAREEFEDLPDMVGGGMAQAYYWFQKNQAILKPGDLLDQIRATLERHSVDHESITSAAGDGPVAADLPEGLMSRILGPGRLGIRHTLPADGDVDAILAEWSEQAGEDPNYVQNLLRVFAAEEHGNICLPNAKCNECEVKICKRLRYR